MQLVLKLRYHDYAKNRFIEENATELFPDSYDEHPASRSYLIVDSGRPVASIRLSLSGWRVENKPKRSCQHFPSFPSYYDILQQCVEEDKSVMEVSRLCISGRRSLITQIYGAATQVADRHECQYLFVAVREDHIPFYERMLFERVTEPRPHPLVQFNTVGMLCHYEIAKSTVSKLRLFRDMWLGPRLENGTL